MLQEIDPNSNREGFAKGPATHAASLAALPFPLAQAK
jgi:hypothetical protein